MAPLEIISNHDITDDLQLIVAASTAIQEMIFFNSYHILTMTNYPISFATIFATLHCNIYCISNAYTVCIKFPARVLLDLLALHLYSLSNCNRQQLLLTIYGIHVTSAIVFHDYMFL